MKKLIIWLALLLPFIANAQVNGTIQKTASSGVVRGNFGSLGIDTIPRVTGVFVNGYILKYNASTNKWYASPDPTLVGLQDSLTKKANRTFDNVASGAIAKAKVDTSANGLLPKSNLFPLGDTRYAKGVGDAVLTTGNQSIGGTKTFTSTVMASINTADAVISNFENTSATGFGGKFRGGFGSRYSFLVTDYNDASLLNISQGVGATFALRLKSPDFDWVRQSNFGYSSDYKTQIIGATSGNQTITFGVDPIANLGGTFTGNGSEYMFRNAGKFITPNSGNTDYNTLFSWNSSGGVLYPTLSGSGDVITGADNTGLLGKITIGSGLSLTSGVLTATGGSSGSVTTAGGTSGRLAKFTSSSNIENSIMTEAGTDISVAGSLTTTAGVDVKTNGGLRLWNAGNSGYGTLGYDGTNITSANAISGTTFTMSGRSNSMGFDVMTNSGLRLYNADNSGYSELAFNGTLITSTHGFSAPSATYSGTISASNFSGTSSGTNTGDQTTITGNAGTATALQTARNIQGVSFNGTADINPINGTGFVKASGTTLSYDNSTYLTTSSASSTYAPLASPTFTGTPSLPTGTIAVTQTQGDNSTKVATTAYVDNAVVPANTLGGGSSKQAAVIYNDISSSTSGTVNLSQHTLSTTTNGDKISFEYAGRFASNSNTMPSMVLTVDGTDFTIPDLTPANGQKWMIYGSIIRVSSVLYKINFNYSQSSSGGFSWPTVSSGTTLDTSSLAITLTVPTTVADSDVVLETASLQKFNAP